MKKKLLLLTSLIVFVLILPSCKEEDLSETIITLIKGRMDAVYTGEAGEEYMELVDTTLVEIEDEYNAKIRSQAIFFCTYMGVLESGTDEAYDALPDDTRKSLEDMFRKIDSKITYEVRDPEKDSDGSYSAELVVTPANVFGDVVSAIKDGTYPPYEEFVKKYNTEETTKENFEAGLAEVLIKLVDDTLENNASPTSKTYVIDVKAENDSYIIDPSIWESIDEGMVTYP